MIRVFIILSLICTWQLANAVDAENHATKEEIIGDWRLTEFALPYQMYYRISSISINQKGWDMVFDIAPSDDCLPKSAVMVVNFGSYIEILDNGLISLSYKLSEQKEIMEISKTIMAKGDNFAFFVLEKLTVKYLLQAKPFERLATWIPASGDGIVKRSSNVYYSLNGFPLAYKKARELCAANK